MLNTAVALFAPRGRCFPHPSNPCPSNLHHQGVSRSQATLKAYVPAGRVLVVHKRGAINGIRIVRWAGSPGITTAEKVERRANPAAAAKALRAGQLLQVQGPMENVGCLWWGGARGKREVEFCVCLYRLLALQSETQENR